MSLLTCMDTSGTIGQYGVRKPACVGKLSSDLGLNTTNSICLVNELVYIASKIVRCLLVLYFFPSAGRGGTIYNNLQKMAVLFAAYFSLSLISTMSCGSRLPPLWISLLLTKEHIACHGSSGGPEW